MGTVLPTEETTELPWYKNRKMMTPLWAGIASILLTFAKAYWPDLDLDSETFTMFLSGIWGVVLLVVGGDVGYDWLGLITDIIKALAEVRQQPTYQAQARHAEYRDIMRALDDLQQQPPAQG